MPVIGRYDAKAEVRYWKGKTACSLGMSERNGLFDYRFRYSWKLILRIWPPLPTNHPASGLAKATAQ